MVHIGAVVKQHLCRSRVPQIGCKQQWRCVVLAQGMAKAGSEVRQTPDANDERASQRRTASTESGSAPALNRDVRVRTSCLRVA